MPDKVSAATPATFRTALRSATALAHTRLDQSLGDQLASATLERYTAFLIASHAVVAPLERGLAAWLPAFAAGDRAAALRSDLQALGAAPSPGADAGVTVFCDLAAARGAAYVLEGSRLGGKVLARLLTARLAPVSGCFAYLQSAGADASGGWRAFLDELDDWGARADEAARSSACESAQATFVAYAQAFAQKGLIPCP